MWVDLLQVYKSIFGDCLCAAGVKLPILQFNLCLNMCSIRIANTIKNVLICVYVVLFMP